MDMLEKVPFSSVVDPLMANHVSKAQIFSSFQVVEGRTGDKVVKDFDFSSWDSEEGNSLRN